jgi:hypothetical protein
MSSRRAPKRPGRRPKSTGQPATAKVVRERGGGADGLLHGGHERIVADYDALPPEARDALNRRLRRCRCRVPPVLLRMAMAYR